MILTIGYEAMRGNAFKRVLPDGKEIIYYIRLRVNESNIAEACEKFKNAKYVVAFDYEGSLSALSGINLTKPVIYRQDIEALDMGVDVLMSTIPEGVRAVFKLPKDYCDMRKILDYSSKYENISFCGGHFIRLPGCKIGCVLPSDIPKKVPENKIPLVNEECSCVFETVTVDDVLDGEFFTAYGVEKVEKVKASKAEKSVVKKEKAPAKTKKKSAASLLDVQSSDYDMFAGF